ncbi:hypothetical protein TKK_0019124 [Trichogramma kaykai]
MEATNVPATNASAVAAAASTTTITSTNTTTSVDTIATTSTTAVVVERPAVESGQPCAPLPTLGSPVLATPATTAESDAPVANTEVTTAGGASSSAGSIKTSSTLKVTVNDSGNEVAANSVDDDNAEEWDRVGENLGGSASLGGGVAAAAAAAAVAAAELEDKRANGNNVDKEEDQHDETAGEEEDDEENVEEKEEEDVVEDAGPTYAAACCFVEALESRPPIDGIDDQWTFEEDALLLRSKAGAQVEKKCLEIISKIPSINIKFVWIPSHIGIIGNEEVDILAKTATEVNLLPPPLVHYMDMFCEFRADAYQASERDNIIQGRDKGTLYFQIMHTSKKCPWFHRLGLPRSFIVTINRMRSNHHSLRESLFRKSIVDGPEYGCGFEEQTLNHVVWSCDRYNAQRKDMIENLRKAGLFPPYNIDSVIADPNIEACLIIVEYLNMCDVRV